MKQFDREIETDDIASDEGPPVPTSHEEAPPAEALPDQPKPNVPKFLSVGDRLRFLNVRLTLRSAELAVYQARDALRGAEHTLNEALVKNQVEIFKLQDEYGFDAASCEVDTETGEIRSIGSRVTAQFDGPAWATR